LLEVIVALTVLTIAGAAAIAMASQAAQAVVHIRHAEDETRRASGFLDAVALWPREDLDRHLGDHREGSWILTVDRPTLTLYLIILATAPDSASGRYTSRELLRTVLYRRKPLNGP
jgi:hypothetical protein